MAFNFLKPLTRHHSDKKNHTKLNEGWGENREPIKEGVTFYVKSLGSTLVEELSQAGQSYGEGASSVAVQAVVAMAKSQGKKLHKVALTTCPEGIKITDFVSGARVMEISIDRIRFCTADSHHDKVFAFIARNTDNETMECHAFLCAKKKMAQAVTLSVAQAFNIAYDEWQEKEKMEMHNNLGNVPKGKNVNSLQKSVCGQFNFSSQSVSHTTSPSSPPPTAEPPSPAKHLFDVMEPRDCLSANHQRASVPALIKPAQNGHRSRDMNSGTANARKNWVSFDDDDVTPCVPRQMEAFSFGTNLRSDDIDDGVRSFIMGSSREEFTRQKSIEDLLDL